MSDSARRRDDGLNSRTSSAARPRSSASISAHEWCATILHSGGSALVRSRRYRAPSNGWNPVSCRSGAYPMSCSHAAASTRSASSANRPLNVLALAATPCVCAQRRGSEFLRSPRAVLSAHSTSPMDLDGSRAGWGRSRTCRGRLGRLDQSPGHAVDCPAPCGHEVIWQPGIGIQRVAARSASQADADGDGDGQIDERSWSRARARCSASRRSW